MSKSIDWESVLYFSIFGTALFLISAIIGGLVAGAA